MCLKIVMLLKPLTVLQFCCISGRERDINYWNYMFKFELDGVALPSYIESTFANANVRLIEILFVFSGYSVFETCMFLCTFYLPYIYLTDNFWYSFNFFWLIFIKALHIIDECEFNIKGYLILINKW